MKVVDDPFDPIFVSAGPAAGRVELQIGEGPTSRYARMNPRDARLVARALLEAADSVEREKRSR